MYSRSVHCVVSKHTSFNWVLKNKPKDIFWECVSGTKRTECCTMCFVKFPSVILSGMCCLKWTSSRQGCHYALKKQDRREGHRSTSIKESNPHPRHRNLTSHTHRLKKMNSNSQLSCLVCMFFKPFGCKRGIHFYYLIVGNILALCVYCTCSLFCSEFPYQTPLHQYGQTAAASRVCRNSLEFLWLKYIVVYLFRSG